MDRASKVLITGGTGFTGAALAMRLLRTGHQVVLLDTEPGIRLDELVAAGAEVRLASITDAAAIDEAMQGVEVVHHLAAAFRETHKPREHFYRVNVTGPRLVLEAAVRHGARKFVHCSTCGVHGHVKDPPAHEDSPIQPTDYYQRTKWLGEKEVQEYTTGKLDTVILRPCALYGPGDVGRFRMLFQQVARGRFPLFGDGKVHYHTLYIENFVDALLVASRKGCGTGRSYLVADAECYTIERLVREVAQVLGTDPRIVQLPLAPLVVAGYIVEGVCKPLRIAPPIYPRRVDWYRSNRQFDITRAKRELGYEPRITLRDGLVRTAAWYHEEGYLPMRRTQ